MTSRASDVYLKLIDGKLGGSQFSGALARAAEHHG